MSLQPPSTITLYTARDVLLSKENGNWLVPYKTFTSSCFACQYFGHSYKECPNINKISGDVCFNCWNSGHSATKCKYEKESPPFVEDYIKPDKLLTKYFNL